MLAVFYFLFNRNDWIANRMFFGYDIKNGKGRGCMNLQEARMEYARAYKMGQKEYHQTGQEHPAVLDEILGENPTNTVVSVGLVNIPTERIVGTKSAGRIGAFSKSFLPLLPMETERQSQHRTSGRGWQKGNNPP